MFYGVEPRGVVVAQGDQLVGRGCAVLLLERVEGGQAVVDLLETLGVGVDALGVVGRRGADVLQLLDDRAQPLGQLPGPGVARADVVKRRLGALEARQDACLLVVERLVQCSERFADAVGVSQHGLLRLQLGDLPRAQARGPQLLGLVAEPLLVAAAAQRLLAQRLQLALQAAQCGVCRGIFGPQRFVARHRIQCRGAELLRGEDQVAVLRVYVDEACA